MSKLDDLDPKRRRFIEEYATDWNATQAAIRAGYSAKTAQEQGSRLLSIVMVQAALAEIMAERAERNKVTVDDAIAELTKEDFKDGRGEDARDVRRVKIRLHPEIPALIELGKASRRSWDLTGVPAEFTTPPYTPHTRCP